MSDHPILSRGPEAHLYYRYVLGMSLLLSELPFPPLRRAVEEDEPHGATVGNPGRKHGLDFSGARPCRKGCWASSCGAVVSPQQRSSPHQASWACGTLGIQKHVESRPFSCLQKTSGIPSNWPCSLSFMCPDQRSLEEGRAAQVPLSRWKVLVGIPFSKNRDKAPRIADTFLSTKIIGRIQ